MNEPTNQQKLNDLPASSDREFWGDAEMSRSSNTLMARSCRSHDLINAGPGLIECTRCPYGSRLPGYMRLLDGEIVDLRETTRA